MHVKQAHRSVVLGFHAVPWEIDFSGSRGVFLLPAAYSSLKIMLLLISYVENANCCEQVPQASDCRRLGAHLTSEFCRDLQVAQDFLCGLLGVSHASEPGEL